jgi:hypothetical protein
MVETNKLAQGSTPFGGLVPIPDPTVLTTQALLREVAALKELVEIRFASSDDKIKHIEDTMRGRTVEISASTIHLRELMQERVATSVADLNGKLDKLYAEMLEKFGSVAAQFSERDTRTDQRAGDTKLAVDAAFAAAEAGFTKQIDAMISIIDTKTVNLAGSISDLKDRLVALESRAATTIEVRRDSRESTGQNLTGISVIIAAVVMAVTIVVAVVFHR